jgi:hypothetical protein
MCVGRCGVGRCGVYLQTPLVSLCQHFIPHFSKIIKCRNKAVHVCASFPSRSTLRGVMQDLNK